MNWSRSLLLAALACAAHSLRAEAQLPLPSPAQLQACATLIYDGAEDEFDHPLKTVGPNQIVKIPFYTSQISYSGHSAPPGVVTSFKFTIPRGTVLERGMSGGYFDENGVPDKHVTVTKNLVSATFESGEFQYIGIFAVLAVRVLPQKQLKGLSAIKVAVHAEVSGGGVTYSSDIADSVRLEGAPPSVSLTANAQTPKAGVTSPNEKIHYVFHASCSDTPNSLAVKAQVPAGTALDLSSVSQGGVVTRKTITWMAPADADEFTAEFTVQTLKSSAVRIRAAGTAFADFPGFARQQAGAVASVRLLGAEKGKLYLIVNGNREEPEADVTVGTEVGINADGWDPDGVDIQIFDGETLITTVAPPGPNTPASMVHIYPFARADLIHPFRAVQGSVTRQLEAQGVPEAQVAFAGGQAIVGDPVPSRGRILRTGGAMAEGELAQGTDGSFSELHFGTTGAALFNLKDGRNALKSGVTNAEVLGKITGRRLLMPVEGKTVSVALKTMNVHGYDPKNGTLNFQTFEGVVAGPQHLTGLVRASGATHFAGNVQIDNCLIYGDGDLSFEAGLSGVGAVTAAGSITVKGALHLLTDDVVAIASGGNVILQAP